MLNKNQALLLRIIDDFQSFNTIDSLTGVFFATGGVEVSGSTTNQLNRLLILCLLSIHLLFHILLISRDMLFIDVTGRQGC